MTLVCVRLDLSHGVKRITALADTRATSRRDDGSLKVVADTTMKLFAIPIRCYQMSELTPVVGAWLNPYHETTIGLGFSGSCFEAQTIIAHLSHKLAALVTPDSEPLPIPTAEGLVHLFSKLVESYFNSHSGDGKPVVYFLVFGFENLEPWIGRVSWTASEGLKSSIVRPTEETLMSVGQDHLFRQYASEWQKRILRHKNKVLKTSHSAHSDEKFEQQVEVGRHDVALSKSTEDEMLNAIDAESVEGIGGVLQRMELALDGSMVTVGFTHDDRDYLSGTAYTVTPGALLGPVPIVQRMGRPIQQKRPRKRSGL